MKTVKYEIKLERSVKVILGAFAFGIILNAFVTPTGQELFGIKNANAAEQVQKIAICSSDGSLCSTIKNHRGLNYLKVEDWLNGEGGFGSRIKLITSKK